MAAISLLMGVFGDDSGVAHFAHLGGMLVGFAYLKLDWRWQALGRKAGNLFEYPAASSGARRGLPALKNWFRRRTEQRRQMEAVRRRQQVARAPATRLISPLLFHCACRLTEPACTRVDQDQHRPGPAGLH